MKKIISFGLIMLVLCTYSIFMFSSCTNREDLLKIGNCADYIWIDDETGETAIDKFKDYYYQTTGRKIKVIYDPSFVAPENMMIKAKSSDYDLICPSDYIIEKMISNDLLYKLQEDLGNDKHGNKIIDYRHNISPLMHNTMSFDKGFKYSSPYMWGTVGISFNRTHLETMAKANPDLNLLEDLNDNGYPDIVESWDLLWNPNFKGKIMMKNSQRDAFVIAAIHKNLSQQYKASKVQKYPSREIVSHVINNSSHEYINSVRDELIGQSKYSYGLEGDEGKMQVINDKNLIAIPQWGGDAFYSIQLGQEANPVKDIDYYVPNEGSNLFCDAWCIPKNAKNTKAANLFINFMCKPEIAVLNMDYIGYSTCSSAPEIEEYLNETYSDLPKMDLSYFFGTSTPLMVSADPRQFPDKNTIERCATMSAFNDKAESDLTNAWIEFIAEQQSS